jgi:N-acetylglutamate synthase-like GNAT family acetyltransferase
MIIRQVKDGDAPCIQGLLAQLGYSDLSVQEVTTKIKRHQLEGYSLLIAEEEENVIGFISLHWFEFLHAKGMIGRITAFCVDEKNRSSGVGRKLLLEAEKVFIQNGCTKLEVTSNQSRQRTHQFYLTNGYVEDSKRFVKYIKP